MKKKSIYKAVMRELMPYVLYVTMVFLMVNGGIFCALLVFEGKSGEHPAPADYAAALYLAAFAVNLLIFAAGAALIVRQLFRYLIPIKNVICHMDELRGTKEAQGAEGGKHVYYQNVDGKVISFLEDYKACLLQLEQAEELVQADFVDKLLNAGFKSKNQLLAEAENVRLPVYGFWYLVIVAEIFSNVTDEDVDVDTIYESGVILDYLKQAMEGGGGYRNAWFRKASYRRMSVVLQLQDEPAGEAESLLEEFSGDKGGRKDSENSEDSLEKILMGLREDLQQRYGVNVSWGVSRSCRDPLYLWKCRDEANMAVGCCDGGRALVIYSPELESSVRCYLPGVARNNLFSYIEAGNADETRKLIALLKAENCVRRNLSRSQFVALNGKIIRMLEKFKDSEGVFTEEMADLLNDFVLQDEGSREKYFELLEDCCIRLCERCGEEKKDKRNRLAREIKTYIDGNFQDKDLCLTQIGAAFNISDSYVSLVFKDYFGVKFSAYLEEIRISRADRLLEESDMTVREIAEQTGYASEQSFRRAFKHARGISPKDARNSVNMKKSV